MQVQGGAEPPPLLGMEVGRMQSSATDDSDNVGGDAQGLIEANSSLRLQIENLKAVMTETDNKARGWRWSRSFGVRDVRIFGTRTASSRAPPPRFAPFFRT